MRDLPDLHVGLTLLRHGRLRTVGGPSARTVRSRNTLVATVSIAFLAGPHVSFGQVASVSGDSSGNRSHFKVGYTATFATEDLTFGRLKGYDTLHLREAHSLQTRGWPALPVKTIRIALPTGMAVTGLTVAAGESTSVCSCARA